MENRPIIKLYSFTLDCPDPQKLADFYAALLGWEIAFAAEEYVCIGAPGAQQGAYPCVLFQRNPEYVPPVWPETPEAQRQMAHMDFAVSDREEAVRHAVRCGAAVADTQYTDDWTVMLDPAGHPFCLCPMKTLVESPQFSLL